jgi:hypothetical protein
MKEMLTNAMLKKLREMLKRHSRRTNNNLTEIMKASNFQGIWTSLFSTGLGLIGIAKCCMFVLTLSLKIEY